MDPIKSSISILLFLAISLPGTSSLAQTFTYKDPTIIENSKASDDLEAAAILAEKEMKACNILLTNAYTILENKSSSPKGSGEIVFSRKKPKVPMSKKEIDFCIEGCVKLLKEEFDYTFDPKTLKTAENKEQAISGSLGSCQIVESKYSVHMDEFNDVKKSRIESGFRACPQAVKDFDFDVARNRVLKQKEICDAKKAAYTAAMIKRSEQLDEANSYLIHHGIKKALKAVTPEAVCPPKP